MYFLTLNVLLESTLDYLGILWCISFITICTCRTSELRKKYIRNLKLLIYRWFYVGDLNVLGQSPRHNM